MGVLTCSPPSKNKNSMTRAGMVSLKAIRNILFLGHLGPKLSQPNFEILIEDYNDALN